MAKDRIIRLMKERIDAWMKIPQTEEYYGRWHKIDKPKRRPKSKKFTIDHFPFFMSITHKEQTTVNVESCGSGLKKDPKYCIDRENKIRIEARFGTKDKGSIAYEADEAPMIINHKKNPLEALEQVLDTNCDDCIKSGLENYLTRKGESRTTKIPFKKFSKEGLVIYLEKDKKEIYQKDVRRLGKIVERAASKIDSLDFVEDCEVQAYFYKEKRRFVNSEGTKIRDSKRVGFLRFEAEVRHKDGGESTFEERIYVRSIKDLLKKRKMYKKINQVYNHLKKFKKAPAQESGNFPTLLDSSATHTKYHECDIGHTLSARIVFEEETTTFSKEKLGKIIYPKFITIIDNPTLKRGYGSYKYDEEGVPSQKIVLIEKGKLKNYLTDRTTSPFLGKTSNGHSRAEGDNDPEPRQTNLEVICSYPKKLTIEDLKEELIKEAKRRKLSYGLYIKGARGEVWTNPNVSQEQEEEEEIGGYEGTLKLRPTKLYRIYLNGREELVSRAEIVEETYNLFKSIKMIGGPYRIDWGLCGSVSGEVPIQGRCPHTLLNASFRKISPKGTTTERLDKDIDV